MQIDYKHTLEIEPEAWFIRLFVVVWGRLITGRKTTIEDVRAGTLSLNFCLLFWGYLFMPLGVLLRILTAPILGVAAILGPPIRRRREAAIARALAAESEAIGTLKKPREPKAPREPSKALAFIQTIGASFLHGAGTLAARGVMVGQAHAKFLRRAGVAIICLALIASVSGLVYGLILIAPIIAANIVDILVFTGVIVGGAATVVAIMLGGIWLAVSGHLDFLPIIFQRGGKATKHGGIKFGHSIKTFGHVMVTGFVAVKSNTCPKIEVKKEAIS